MVKPGSLNNQSSAKKQHSHGVGERDGGPPGVTQEFNVEVSDIVRTGR